MAPCEVKGVEAELGVCDLHPSQDQQEERHIGDAQTVEGVNGTYFDNPGIAGCHSVSDPQANGAGQVLIRYPLGNASRPVVLRVVVANADGGHRLPEVLPAPGEHARQHRLVGWEIG